MVENASVRGQERGREEILDAAKKAAAEGFVKIHVTFDAAEQERVGPAGEYCWAKPAEGGYRIDNIPFFHDHFVYEDVVSAKKIPNDTCLEFVAVVKRGGWNWFAIIFRETPTMLDDSAAIMARLRETYGADDVRFERAMRGFVVGVIRDVLVGPFAEELKLLEANPAVEETVGLALE